MIKRITAMYFSGTGTTKKIVTAIAREIAGQDSAVSLKELDFTRPAIRKEPAHFSQEDLVIIGVPVYAGRVPNVLLKFLSTVKGDGAAAVPVVVYGNRNFDDALIELKEILENNGFTTLAAGAFVAEHSFSTVLAQGRPDTQDMAVAQAFAQRIYEQIDGRAFESELKVSGNSPYRPYYVPTDKLGNPFDFRRITPKTNVNCVDCKHCAQICAMGSIDIEDVSRITGPCIKCCACIKSCPVQAKYFDDEGYLNHQLELERECTLRREPEIFFRA